MKPGVVFDLDGTLIDSIPDVRHALNRTLASIGRPPVTVDLMKSLVGEGARTMMERALNASGGPGPDVAALLRDYLAFYSAHPVVDTHIFAGGRAVLDRLAAQGYLLGICTNKPSAITRLVIEGLGLGPLFAAVLGADDVTNRKPHGDHVLATMMAMGCDRAVMVGDSSTDVTAARNAGIPVIAVDFGYAEGGAQTLNADAVITAFDQLDAQVERLLPIPA